MAVECLLSWLQQVYLYKPDFLLRRSPFALSSWGDPPAANITGADYTTNGGDNTSTNTSSPMMLGSAENLTFAANIGLATGVLLAVLFKSHYEGINRDWRSEHQVWTEAVTTRVVFGIVCLLLALVAAPLALVLFIWFSCYRSIVHTLLKIIHRLKYVGLMDGVDTVWALEEDTSKSIVNVLGMLEVDDAPDDDVLMTTLRQVIMSRFFKPANSCQKLFHLRRRSLLGYFYWERQNSLEIDSYVRWMPDASRLEDDGGISERTLTEIVSKLANTKLPANHSSSWEILLSHRPMTKLSEDPFQSMEEGFPVKSGKCRKYPVLFRIHHAVGDGVALMQMMIEALDKDSHVNRENLAEHRDNNLPDICVTTGDTLCTDGLKISQNVTETCLQKYLKSSKTINAEKQTHDTTSLSKIKIEMANEKVFYDQPRKTSYEPSCSTCCKEKPPTNSSRKSKLSASQPFEFHSNKIYSKVNTKIPCYVTGKKEVSKNVITKSVSIKKENPNMVVYFQNYFPANEPSVCGVDGNVGVPHSNDKSFRRTVPKRNDTLKTSEIDNTGIDNTETDSDMFDLEIDTFTAATENTVRYRNNSLTRQLSELSDQSEYSDESISYSCSSLHSHASSPEIARKSSPAFRTKSPILRGDLGSQTMSVYLEKFPTTDDLCINDDVMYSGTACRSYTPDVKIRPSSPPSRPLTPTPYSLLQETLVASTSSPSLETRRPISPSSFQSRCDNRPYSPTSAYFNSETRPSTPHDLLPNINDRPVSPSCLISIQDVPNYPNTLSESVNERLLQNKTFSSLTDTFATMDTTQSSILKRSHSPNKLEDENYSMYAMKNSTTEQCNYLWRPSPLEKKDYSAAETSDNNEFLMIPLDCYDKQVSHYRSEYFKNSGINKVRDFLKNIFADEKKETMLVKNKHSPKVNCYVKLLSVINGENGDRFQVLSNIWNILSTLIYAPASLMHQMLMKTSDNNSLHGPSLSGEKLIMWYSDSSMPSICREYRLMNTIKRIKSRVACKVSFTDVFLTAVSSSLETYFLSNGTDVPSSVNVVVPLRMEPMPSTLSRNEDDVQVQSSFEPNVQHISENIKTIKSKFLDSGAACIEVPIDMEVPQPSNQFSVALLSLPIAPRSTPTCDEPLKPYSLTTRLQEVCKHSELLRKSLDYRVNYWLMKIVASLLPVSLLKPILNSTQSTMVVSNVKGPAEDIYLGSYRLSDLVFWVPNRGTTGVGVSLMGYAGRLQVGLIADTAVVPTRRDAQLILYNIVSELRQMDAALSA